MSRRKKEIVPMIPKKKCVHCGMDLEYKQFHKSGSDIYMGNNNLFPVCKECMKILYEQYRTMYLEQFSILGTEPEENTIEKLTIKSLCMLFDIYYSDRLFGSALKNQEKFTNVDLITAYMRIINLKQNKNKTYDDTISEENLSQESMKSAMVDKVRERFNDRVLYQNIYDLCLKLAQSLRKDYNIDSENNDYSADDWITGGIAYEEYM